MAARTKKKPQRVLEAHLGSLNVADKLLVACLDADVVGPTPDVVGPTPDELLELIWGR